MLQSIGSSDVGIKKIGLHKNVVGALIATAVFGYVLGYGKFYAFHFVLILYWLFVIIGFIKIRKSSLNTMLLPVLFFIFMVISLIWTPNVINGLYYLFYFFCGYSIIIAIINYANDVDKLNYLFKVAAFFFTLNFFIGVLESTGYFRLPQSFYYGEYSTRPSGFNGNLNNFGFVFIAIFPFLFLYPKLFVKVFFTILALWFTLRLESKGFFLGLCVFFMFYLLVHIKKKITWQWLFLILSAAIVAVLAGISPNGDVTNNHRALSAFAQIDRAADLVMERDFEDRDSTGVRVGLYLYGLNELVNSYGIGRGVAGVGTKLAQDTDFFDTDKGMVSFHNFFLEMLVDLGFIPFFIMMLLYSKLIKNLLRIKNISMNIQLKYFSKASALSLLTILPASISPSSIIYVFTFWMVIGFAIATLNVMKSMENH